MPLRLTLVIILHVSSVLLLPDNYYEDESLVYIGNRPNNHKYQKPLQTSNQVDENVHHYGHMRDEKYITPFRDDYEDEYDDPNVEFSRPTRSQEKTDNFVRFGRGNSDFIRYGRDPYQRHQRRSDQNFIRFGRNTDTEAIGSRAKRSTATQPEQKRRNKDDFLRFGRGGDDSFIRYGRNYPLEIGSDVTTSPVKPNNFLQRQSLDYPSLKERAIYNVPLLIILKKLEELKENN